MKFTKLRHPSHPEHKLKLMRHEDPFICDGCKEIGFGLSYRCTRCEFDLHEDCALPTSPAYHPFYKKCNLKFFDCSTSKRKRNCNACGLEVKGFSYCCKKCGIYLHPCCFKLKFKFISEKEKKFQLRDKISSKCYSCGNKEINNDGVTGWAYVSEGKYHFHVSCVKDMLLKKWKEDHVLVNKKNSRDLEINKPNFPLIKTSKTSVGGKKSKYLAIIRSVFISILSAILGDPIGGVAWLINVWI